MNIKKGKRNTDMYESSSVFESACTRNNMHYIQFRISLLRESSILYKYNFQNGASKLIKVCIRKVPKKYSEFTNYPTGENIFIFRDHRPIGKEHLITLGLL